MDRRPAIVALFTPDDIVRLHPRLCEDKEPVEEKELRLQARPNVLFEAGMAFAISPKRTVVVQLGEVKLPSDIGGRHVAHLTDATESRNSLATKLEGIGCSVNRSGNDWTTEGDFDAAVRGYGAVVGRPTDGGGQSNTNVRPPALGNSEQAVLLALFNDGGEPTLGELADLVVYGEGAVRFALMALKKKGLVEESKTFGPEGTLPGYRATDEGSDLASKILNASE